MQWYRPRGRATEHGVHTGIFTDHSGNGQLWALLLGKDMCLQGHCSLLLWYFLVLAWCHSCPPSSAPMWDWAQQQVIWVKMAQQLLKRRQRAGHYSSQGTYKVVPLIYPSVPARTHKSSRWLPTHSKGMVDGTGSWAFLLAPENIGVHRCGQKGGLHMD